jgi:hypothetical protein
MRLAGLKEAAVLTERVRFATPIQIRFSGQTVLRIDVGVTEEDVFRSIQEARGSAVEYPSEPQEERTMRRLL